MKTAHLLIAIVFSSLILGSFKQSSDVVADGWLQKRKYRKGFHLDLAKHKKQESTFQLSADLPPFIEKSDSISSIKNSDPTALSVEEKKGSHLFENLRLTKHQFLQNIENRKEHNIAQNNEEPQGDADPYKANKRRILGWSVSAFLSLALVIAGIALIASFSVPVLPFVMFYIAAHMLPVSIILLRAYIKEHQALKNGSQFLSEERVLQFRKTAKRWSKITFIGGLLFLLLSALVLGFIIFTSAEILAMAVIAALIALGALFLTVAYWIATTSSVLSNDGSFNELLKLFSLFFYQAVISVIMVVVVVVLVLVLIWLA